MDKYKTLSLIGFTLVALALSGCGGGEKPAETGEAGGVIGEALPEGFELLSGDGFNVDDYKGKVLVVDFWATWCPPCKMEIPELIEINDEYKDNGVVLVGITGDDDAETSVPEFAKESGLNYRNYIMNDAIDKEYNITGWPTKVIYDANGKEVFRKTGFMTKDQLVAEIEKHLPPA
jgi:thiol-disulfide isomerase/thioredoxin